MIESDKEMENNGIHHSNLLKFLSNATFAKTTLTHLLTTSGTPIGAPDTFCHLSTKRRCISIAVRSELGRFLLHIKIYTAMLKYWNILNDLIDNPIIVDARIVNEDIHLSKDYTFSWLSSIEMLMKVTGYSQGNTGIMAITHQNHFQMDLSRT